jgi:hypothetical protein
MTEETPLTLSELFAKTTEESEDNSEKFEDTTIFTWELEAATSFLKYTLKRPFEDAGINVSKNYPLTLCVFTMFADGTSKVDLRREVTYEIFQTIADDLIIVEEHAHELLFTPEEDDSKFDYGPSN